MRQRVVAVITRAPLPYSHAIGSLDAVLAAAVFEHSVAVVFWGEGILQLVSQKRTPEQPKAVSAQWGMAPDYEITELYVVEENAKQMNLDLSSLVLPVKVISLTQAQDYLKTADWVITG